MCFFRTQIGERCAIIYSLNEIHTHVEDLPDSFYDLTVNDLKLVLRDLKNIAAGNEDAPLVTERLRELRDNRTMLNKMSQYKNCVIRIKFPDRCVLQGMFKPIDKISDIIEFVRTFLRKPAIPFYLCTYNILKLFVFYDSSQCKQFFSHYTT